jgi:hypothetical protein
MWVIVLVVLGIFFVIFSFINSIKKYRWWILMLFLIFTAYVTFPTIQGVIDIIHNSYVTCTAEYYRSDEANTRNSLIATESVQITNHEGKTVILKGATQDFPRGRYTGTVTYAKRSKIIISFVPN